MKKLLNNKKGFTLIELLAVIVILAILVMVAIPAVTKYLNAARQGTFADNAKSAISAVRNDVIMNGFTADSGKDYMTYDETEINNLLEKKLENGPFGSSYKDIEIAVFQTGSGNNYTYQYQMCLTDGTHGFGYTEENAIEDSKVLLTGAPASCGTPTLVTTSSSDS